MPIFNPTSGANLKYLGTITYAAATTGTLSSLPAYDEYVLYGVMTSTVSQNLLLRLNGDTGNNYAHLSINNTTPTATNATSGISLGGMTADLNTLHSAVIGGKTTASAGGRLSVNCCNSGRVNDYVVLEGQWTGGNNTQVNSVTVLITGGGTITGEIVVYGRNRD